MLARPVRAEHEDVVALTANGRAEAQRIKHTLLSDEACVVVEFGCRGEFELARIAGAIEEFGGYGVDGHIADLACSVLLRVFSAPGCSRAYPHAHHGQSRRFAAIGQFRAGGSFSLIDSNLDAP
ncbi:MAG: hypothetical protein ABJ325_21990 [Nitratireductor sp.]